MTGLLHSLPDPQAASVHYLLESAALLVGGLLYWRTANAATQPTDRLTRWGILAGAALGAALCSRGLYLLQYWHALEPEPVTVWFSGKTIVGGLIGAVAGVEIAKHLLGWQRSTGDGFVLPLAVAIVIGRLGCQLAGIGDLTYGNSTSLPWAWDYGDGLSRHPTALYEIIGVLAMTVWVLGDRRRFRVAGDRFRAFLSAYLLMRLLLDLLKPPFGPAAAGTLQPERCWLLTPIQWACLLALAYYARDITRLAATRGTTGG